MRISDWSSDVCSSDLLFRDASKSYEESNREYNAIVRRVAAEAADDVVFIDIEASFKDIAGDDREKLANLLLADGLHLSRKGHDVYFGVIADKIEIGRAHV